MDIYAENILDHFRSPRNAGLLQNPTITHSAKNISCGDEIIVSLILDEGNVIKEIGWEGTGCAISQASMSLLSEELIGKHRDDIEKMNKEDIYKLLGVPIGPRRFKCALMSLHCIKNALRKFNGDSEQGWIETVTAEE